MYVDDCVWVILLDITTPPWWREKVIAYYVTKGETNASSKASESCSLRLSAVSLKSVADVLFSSRNVVPLL